MEFIPLGLSKRKTDIIMVFRKPFKENLIFSPNVRAGLLHLRSASSRLLHTLQAD